MDVSLDGCDSRSIAGCHNIGHDQASTDVGIGRAHRIASRVFNAGSYPLLWKYPRCGFSSLLRLIIQPQTFSEGHPTE
ncbi:hypothetical protein B0G77_0724 [Paraburkholderia sp. BL10I2N1]|nr:hypothetical protein B0G77_0724 [Paraburkholderia sp. BL10I2N1]